MSLCSPLFYGFFLSLFYCSTVFFFITKTLLFKYFENFNKKKKKKKKKKKTEKFWKISDKNSDVFFISAQNIDCGYSLEAPRWGDSNEYP